MSELEKRETLSRYDSMSTEELQEILLKHLNGELETEPDTDELYYIMEVLARRREEENPQAFRSDEEALADFRKNYMPKATQEGRTNVIRFPNRVFKMVAAVLVVVLIFAVGMSISAEAFHLDIWGKFANWTKEIFQFTDTPQGTKPENPEKEYNAELKSLQDALNDQGIKKKLVPTWMPGGYKNIDLIPGSLFPASSIIIPLSVSIFTVPDTSFRTMYFPLIQNIICPEPVISKVG